MAEPQELTKRMIRSRVWQALRSEMPPGRRHYSRIPIFPGADKAAQSLTELPEFRNANALIVNLDKPLEYVRLQALEHDKNLFVPFLNRRSSKLMKSVSKEPDAETTLKTVSAWSMKKIAKTVPMDEPVHVDMLVVGSVAVSRDGRNIGRGRGWDDLQYAVLKEKGFITDDTKIVTVVHDTQVFDSLPSELFGKHDVPVDLIITPNDVIQVAKRLPRPETIFWDMLTPRQVQSIRVLDQLRNKHQEKGLDVTLKKVDESERPKSGGKQRASKTSGNSSQEENGISSNGNGKKKPWRRAKGARKDDGTDNENQSSEPMEKSPRKRNIKRQHQKLSIDFSLLVSNIDGNVRVRDIKNALTKRGIMPDDITWKGYKGFCYLHYSKPFNKNNKEIKDKDEPFSVDMVIECLQSLKFDTKLCVNVMEPITRIETTDVTSV